MSKNDYTALDRAIIDTIRGGRKTGVYSVPRLQELAAPFCKPDPWGGQTPGWRIVDRRLQALRKAGAIAYAHGEWRTTLS